jgi:hypothetical protein
MVMETLWPWLAVAAAGALHGLNPATGWAFAGWAARAGGRSRVLVILAPIALGHVLSLIVVAAAVPLALQLGVEFDARLPQGLAAGLLLALAVHYWRARWHGRPCAAGVGRGGVALWSFIVGTAHGAGWMLVPALVPLCAGDMPAREITATGSLGLALAAVGVHLVAMLSTTAAMAAGARPILDAAFQRLVGRREPLLSPTPRNEGNLDERPLHRWLRLRRRPLRHP